MSQILNPNDFILFNEPYTKKAKMPCFVNMQKADPHFPPNGILESGDQAIRNYWNMKNLRKREKK